MAYLEENLLDMLKSEWSDETYEYIKKLSYILANDVYVKNLHTEMTLTKDFLWKARSDYNSKLYPGVRVKFKSLTPDQLGSKLSEHLKKDDGYYYGWIHSVNAFPGEPIHLFITVVDVDNRANVTTAIANQTDVEVVEELPEAILNDLYEYSKLYHGKKNSPTPHFDEAYSRHRPIKRRQTYRSRSVRYRWIVKGNQLIDYK